MAKWCGPMVSGPVVRGSYSGSGSVIEDRPHPSPDGPTVPGGLGPVDGTIKGIGD